MRKHQVSAWWLLGVSLVSSAVNHTCVLLLFGGLAGENNLKQAEQAKSDIPRPGHVSGWMGGLHRVPCVTVVLPEKEARPGYCFY